MVTNESNAGPLLDVLVGMIKERMRLRIAEEFELKKEELIAAMDKRKDEIVAAILIDAMHMVEMQTMNDRIVFTIRKADAK